MFWDNAEFEVFQCTQEKHEIETKYCHPISKCSQLETAPGCFLSPCCWSIIKQRGPNIVLINLWWLNGLMKLIGKSSCVLWRCVASVGMTHNTLAPPVHTMLSSVCVDPHSPGLVCCRPDFLIISCSSWSWATNVSHGTGSHPAGGLVHFYLKWELRVWLLWNLWLYLSLRVARICTEKRPERGGSVLIQYRGTPT